MKMINKDNGFDLGIRWRFPGGREYAFALLALFTFLTVIYANSLQGAFQFDDKINIVENNHIFLKSFNWPDIKNTFYGIQGQRIDRPLAYLSFALNYYCDGLNVTGYHIINFIIHYLASAFLFVFIYGTLQLPSARARYGPASYSIALLAAVLWASSPVQVTSVTYIVQRMASMAGLFYIMAMYFYLKGRTANRRRQRAIFWSLCVFSAVLSLGTKENAVMLPVSIWLYDLFLIQGVTRENLIKNLKIIAPLILIAAVIGFWYVDISSIFNGTAYQGRPFTLKERLLTEPRIIIFYITLLLYPISSRLTLIHDIELSTSFFTPWVTLPAIFLILSIILLAVYLARRRPFIAFCILFFFLNHVIEGTFIPLELIYEHRNYIPSMFFFVPLAVVMLRIIDYFAYQKAIQFIMVAVFTFLLAAQGHTVYVRNILFAHPVLLWTDNLEKTTTLSRPYNNLGSAYWNLKNHDKAYALYTKALSLDRQNNLSNRGVNLHNLGMYHLHVRRDYDKALKFYTSAIKAYPGYWPSYHDAAVCFIRKGDMQEAGKRLVAALSLWPDKADLRYSLGFVLLKVGENDQAIKQTKRALSYNPDLSNAFAVLGEAYRRKKHYDTAISYWTKYLETNPHDLEGNLALVELYSQKNDREDLSRVIGKLVYLKGATEWRNLVESLLKDKTSLAYEPSPEEIVSIIQSYLCGEFHH